MSVANVGRLALLQADPFEDDVTESSVQLVIDPSDRFCYLQNYSPSQGSTDEEFSGRHLNVRVETTSGPVDGPNVVKWLRGSKGQTMLARVCDGHSVEWDGRNHVGKLDDDAKAAIDDLIEWLSEAPALNGESAGVWHASDWLYDEDEARSEYEITAETTDERIAEIAAQIELEAKEKDAILIDLTDYVTELRDQLRDDA